MLTDKKEHWTYRFRHLGSLFKSQFLKKPALKENKIKLVC